MAMLFRDGFDRYGPPTIPIGTAQILLTQGVWTFQANAGPIVAPLSSTGYAILMASTGCTLSKTLATNYSRLFGGVRFNVGILTNNQGLQFLDNSTPQAGITIDRTTGTISIRTGGIGGTAIATSSVSVTVGVTHQLAWDVTFANPGTFNIYLDGILILTGSGNLAPSGNNTADVFQLAGATGTGNNITFDDLYLNDASGSQNNSIITTSPRIETQFPTGDQQTQFTNVASTLGTTYTNGSASTVVANSLFLRPFTPPVSMTLNSISSVPQTTSGIAKFKAVVYADSAGSPGSLLSSGVEVTGSTAGTILTGSLVTPQSLIGGTQYWIGFINNTAISYSTSDAGLSGQRANNTYTSGAPATAPVMTAGQANWQLWGNCTGALVNWETQNLNPPPGSISEISSVTVGQEDLYTFPALSVAAAAIYDVAVSCYAARSDTGPRTMDMRMKSGATDSGGSATGQTPGTSFSWLVSDFPVDPNTGVAWLKSGLDAATSGPKLAS